MYCKGSVEGCLVSRVLLDTGCLWFGDDWSPRRGSWRENGYQSDVCMVTQFGIP